MKTVITLLADSIYDCALREAKSSGIDPSTLCSGVLTEHFTTAQTRQTQQEEKKSLSIPKQSGQFKVSDHFPNYPVGSIDLAQAFVDEALRINGAYAFRAKSDRGVGISPNFVFIEYLKKGQFNGIGVSFYGKPTDHIHAGKLRPGRNPNYSRAIINSWQELDLLLPEIRKSHDLQMAKKRRM